MAIGDPKFGIFGLKMSLLALKTMILSPMGDKTLLKNLIFQERTGFFDDDTENFDQLVEKMNDGQYTSPNDFEQDIVDLIEACKNSVDDRRSAVSLPP